jgi:hypothetical protein
MATAATFAMGSPYIGAAIVTGLGISLNYISSWLPDNEPIKDIKADDAESSVKKNSRPPHSGPPPTTSPPPSIDKPIDLYTQFQLDIKNYEEIKLAPDRSFIRAFYYIRNLEDPTVEQLQTFVETNLIAPIGRLPQEHPDRVNFVMHFSKNFGKVPYINFSIIRDALTKAFYLDDESLFTIEDLLKVAKVSSNMRAFLQTNDLTISTLLEAIEKILPYDGNFYKKPSSDETNFSLSEHISNKDKQPTLQLFKNLWVKMKDRKSIIEKIEECLKVSCETLVANSKNTPDQGGGYQQSNRDYNTFIKGLLDVQSSEINFSKRCGVGDVLALGTQPNICVTFLKANRSPYNYGCKKQNKIYKDDYIIYKYENNHCVLLIPKKLVVAQPKIPPLPNTGTSANPSILKGKTAEVKTAEKGKRQQEVKTEQVSNNCVEYETELFIKGGTRKRRKRKHKVVTKRRQGRNRKSRRKGTRRI